MGKTNQNRLRVRKHGECLRPLDGGENAECRVSF